MEIKLREAQFKYYRDKLLNKAGSKYKLKNLIEEVRIAEISQKEIKKIEDGEIEVFQIGKENLFKKIDIFSTEEAILINKVQELNVRYANQPFSCINGVIAFKKKSDFFDLKYLYYILQKQENKISFLHYTGAVWKNLFKGSLLNHEVFLLNFEDQRRIGEILYHLEKNIKDLNKSIEKEALLRQKQKKYVANFLFSFQK